MSFDGEYERLTGKGRDSKRKKIMKKKTPQKLQRVKDKGKSEQRI